jgi:hypothetical protein
MVVKRERQNAQHTESQKKKNNKLRRMTKGSAEVKKYRRKEITNKWGK